METWKVFGTIVFILILFVTPMVHAEQKIYTTLINDTSIYLSPGETWPFYQGYSFSLKSIIDDRSWMALKFNDTIIKSAVLSPGETFFYNETLNNSSERVIISLKVAGVYSGENTDIVAFSHVYQYSDLTLPAATPIGTKGPDNSNNTSNGTNSTTDRTRSPGFQVISTLIIIGIYCILIRKSRKQK